ncbi:hypothetical protein FEE96_05640 [Parasedimentitalea maritima]|uniref:DUF4345 domain-containing protein n=1 Tax=Parasedimentitalea maritima TaxID=2578117 RepID=A0ABY2UZP3_9RHOB|nr:hypothetical protein [Zongyanglinia marina]TLP68001.1 hypothetical protein FEE96_05640 [Zongyanglinia marina]
MTKLFLTTTLLAGVLQCYLSYALLTDPEAMIASFGLPTDASVAFVARRAGAMFLGLAALSFAAAFLYRNQKIAALALAMPWLCLALLGSYEHMRGAVGAEIYPALVIETTFAVLFLLIGLFLRDHTTAKAT